METRVEASAVMGRVLGLPTYLLAAKPRP